MIAAMSTMAVLPNNVAEEMARSSTGLISRKENIPILM